MSLRDQLQSTLGNAYTLERELGGGGMSRVFLAEETALGRKVVVKVLPPDVAASVNADRFKREIQVAARLQHPHIVPVLSSGEMQGIPYYTMPFVEGESVRVRLARSGALPVTEIIGVLRDVAKALAYAHERGIVHRDIKPDNILLSGGSATVTDFGIAKAIAAARSGGDVDRPETLTTIGASIGTPAYMAPEQAAADPATNHRADIYAFGCTAYELLAGRPPFSGKSPQALLAAQMGDTPAHISTLRADTPDVLAELVMRCLEKDADARPQHASDLARVLETVTSGGTHAPMPSVLLSGKGMLARALGAYAAAFVFVAVLAKAAIVGIGLPDWVFPGALLVMALGLPVILFTAYVHRTTRRIVTQTPTYTPGGSASATHGTMATLAMRASPHMSWRRAWLGGVFAVGAFVVLIGAYMVTRALGVGPFGSLLAAGTLQERDKLLVADFEGDTSLAPVVTDAFRTALSQSRSITLMQPNDVRDVLRRMQRPATTRIDGDVAREISSREGSRAYVVGAVRSIGGKYILSAQLVSPQTGANLATVSSNADGEDEILKALDKLAMNLRERIGESLRDVQSTPALERVTTPSLDALKKYVQGSRLMSFEADFTKGVALLEDAIRIDTAFAMAYRRLAVEYSNRNQPDRAMQLLQKAFDHQDRLSDAERYIVLGSYYQRGPKQDLAKSTAAYETLIELQPDFQTALNNVSINYRQQRNWSKAEEYLRRGIALGRPPGVMYNQLIWTLWNQKKYTEAWDVLAQYDSAYPANPQRLARRAELLYSERRFDSATSVLRGMFKTAAGNPTGRGLTSGFAATMTRTQGKLREAQRWETEALEANRQRGIKEADLTSAARQAAADVLLLNDRARAIANLERAWAQTPLESLDPGVRPFLELGEGYAVVGRADRVRQVIASFEQGRKQVQRSTDDVEARVLQGYLAFAERRYDDAVREFQASDQTDCVTCALPWIAYSYDMAGKTDSALVTYERYLNADDNLRWISDPLFLAASLRRAGELHEAKGEAQQALSNYLAFVEMWKDADRELQPRVAEVRARINRLKDTEARQR
jgi:tetratricopeptide (TPR) repeat protein/tRNA A-37 threonylcarbamoyl transferase component Bud32